MTIKELVKNLTPVEERQEEDVWSAEKIEKLLKELNIKNYQFDYECRVVILFNLDDLYKVMIRAGVKELSESCRLSMSKFAKKVCLEVGSWQFEAEDTRKS